MIVCDSESAEDKKRLLQLRMKKSFQQKQKKEISWDYANGEGIGRKYGTGGDACNYCGVCHGTADWCPLMDDD